MARGADLVIADTAGRLHTRTNLMDELAKVRRIIDKRLPGGTPETLFVLDATTGQNGLAQAKAFHEAVGLTGIVLTKLDSTAKGGIVFAIEHALGVPVRFVGVGEGVADLIPFDPRGVRGGAVRLTGGSAADRLVALDLDHDRGGLGQGARATGSGRGSGTLRRSPDRRRPQDGGPGQSAQRRQPGGGAQADRFGEQPGARASPPAGRSPRRRGTWT